jgi:hypothetical protein
MYMTDNVYYQGSAKGSGNPDALPQTVSADALPPSDATPELNGNEPVSKAELRQILEGVKQDVLRQTQSHTDKLGSALDKRIKSAQEKADTAINLAKASGVNLSPEQERVVRQTAVNEAMAARDDSPAVPEQGRQVEGAEQSTYVQREVEKIFRKTGVYIAPEDANALIGEVDSPYEYLKKFEEICADRANRPQAEARIATMFPNAGKPAGLDQLQRQYDEEMAQIVAGKHPTVRRGNAAQVVAFKQEYRKKGLTSIW